MHIDKQLAIEYNLNEMKIKEEEPFYLSKN